MTTVQKNYIKSNWMTLANFILLLGIVVQQSRWQQRVDTKIEEFDKHKANMEMHIPLKESIHIFVPRVELDARMKNMEQTLSNIDKKLDKLN